MSGPAILPVFEDAAHAVQVSADIMACNEAFRALVERYRRLCDSPVRVLSIKALRRSIYPEAAEMFGDAATAEVLPDLAYLWLAYRDLCAMMMADGLAAPTLARFLQGIPAVAS